VERGNEGNPEALEEMGVYCDGDIVVEDVYLTMQNYIRPNTCRSD
jgi:hypothetical protein